MNLKTTIIISIIVVLSIPFVWGERLIVASDSAATQDFGLAVNFLNKYVDLLDKPQTDVVADAIRRVKEDGFRYTTGTDATLKALSGAEDFSISFDDGIYTARWVKGGKIIVSCSFPANIGLLTFSNKIDLENQLIADLSAPATDSDTIILPVRAIAKLTPVSFSDFYVEDKGFYITPRLKHQLIFKKDGAKPDTCVLLTDSLHYQVESIANMILSGYSDNPHPISLKVSQYGYKSQAVPTSLSTLYRFLARNGSIPYWGVETFDGQTVKGLWVWINRLGGFAHMLTVTVPVKALTDSSPLEAKLHCYLRLDNLKTMFEEYPDL